MHTSRYSCLYQKKNLIKLALLKKSDQCFDKDTRVTFFLSTDSKFSSLSTFKVNQVSQDKSAEQEREKKQLAMRRLIYQLAIDLCRVYFNTSRSANHCQQGSISSGTNKYQLSAQTFYDSPPLQNYGQIQLHGSYQLLLLQLISKNPLQFVVVHSLVFLLDGYIDQTCAIVPYPKGNSNKSRQSCYFFG